MRVACDVSIRPCGLCPCGRLKRPVDPMGIRR